MVTGYLWTIALILHDLLKTVGLVPDRLSDRWGY